MSALSVCFCPSCSCCWCLCGQCSLFSIKGDARWLLLGKFCILSHWYLSPYLTSIDVDALCDPTTLVPSPSLIPWWCLPVSSFSFYYMLAQYSGKLSFYQSSKWKGNFESPPPPLLLAWPQTIWSIFTANLIQGLTVGGMGAELISLLDNFSLSSLPATFPSGQRAFYFSSLGDRNAVSSFLPILWIL